MKTTVKQKARQVRFRRWSRVGYAVFCSLTCCVTIGCLSVSVSDKMFQKTDGISTNELYFSASEADSKNKEVLESDVVIRQIQEVLLSEIPFDDTTACGRFTSYIINYNG
jgi:hypothetical protein